MTESPEIPANPQLSPGFDKARKLSKILVVLLTIGLVLVVFAAVCFTIYMASPGLQAFIAEHARKPIPAVGWGKYVLIVLSGIPGFIAMIYARRLFERFAAGDVFSGATIGAIRAAAFWLVIAGIIPPEPLTLIVGIATYVAAYVMAEALRLADDSASIV